MNCGGLHEVDLNSSTCQSSQHPGGSLFDIKIEQVYSIGVSNKEPAKADVLQGTLDIMILQTLATLGASHGYAIAGRLEQVSGGRVQVNMGTLYPGLMRLEQRGFISGRWGVTDNKRRARFYALTAAGRRQLAVEKQEWNRTVTIMQALLGESK
jgi:PadR family transcriptional regulator PadR